MRRSGYTLLEITVTMLLVSGIMLTVSQGLKTGVDTAATVAQSSENASSVNRVLHDLAMELRSADKDFMYKTEGEEVEFSYVVCTGFDDAGNPIYDEGEYGRRIVFDKNEGTLTKYVITDSGDDYALLLASNLPDDGFSVQQMGDDATIYGNRLLLSLATEEEDVHGNMNRTDTSRIVFLRSYLFHSDGISGASENDAEGSTNTDATEETGGEEVVDGEETGGTQSSQDPTEPQGDLPPADLFEPDGPSIVWGDNQASEDGLLLIIVKLIDNANWKLDEENVYVQYYGDNFDGMTVTYGWDSNHDAVQSDEIRITGSYTGTLGITVFAQTTAKVQGQTTYAKTVDTNYY